MMTFTHIHTLPSGHKLFRFESTGKIAIADESGATPLDTDDGILTLDFDRPLIVGSQGGSVPLNNHSRSDSTIYGSSATPVGPDSALILSAMFGWDIRVTPETTVFAAYA